MKFKNDTNSRKEERSEIGCISLPAISQPGYKRKHANSFVKFNIESLARDSIFEENIDFRKSKNSAKKSYEEDTLSTTVEIDQDMIMRHGAVNANAICISRNDNNNKPTHSNTRMDKKASMETSKKHTSIREFHSVNDDSQMKLVLQRLNEKAMELPNAISIPKKRKSLVKQTNSSHQRFSTYNLEPRYTFEQFNRTHIRNVEKRKERFMKDISEDDNRSMNANSSVTEWNQMPNICEINISPSLMSHDGSVELKKNHNLTISIDSNQNSPYIYHNLMQNQNHSSISNDMSISRRINQESIYKDAMTMNKNCNHLFENKNASKDPVVLKYFKQSIRKIDRYMEMCIGNNSNRYLMIGDCLILFD